PELGERGRGIGGHVPAVPLLQSLVEQPNRHRHPEPPIMPHPSFLPSRTLHLITLTLAAVLALLCAAAAGPSIPTARAAAPIELTRLAVESRFPRALALQVEVTAPAGVTDLSLRLRIGAGEGTVLVRPDFTPGARVVVEHELPTGGAKYIPPGTAVEVQVEAQDAAGARLVSPPQQFLYLDNRVAWETMSARGGLVTAYYYRDGQERARRALRGAELALDKMQSKAGVVVDRPFKLIIYNTLAEWKDAYQPRSESFNQQVGIAGLAYGGYDLVLLQADPLSVPLTYLESVAAHEVTHLVVHRAGGGGVAAWLNEGLAVYGQPEPDRYMLNAVTVAAKSNDLLLVRGIQNLPGQPDKVGLFYGEAYSLAKRLLENYPPDKMRNLLAALRSREDLDAALQAVYGFDQDGLDAAWRTSLGAPPREYATAAPTVVAAPVVELMTVPQSVKAGAPAGQPAADAAALPRITFIPFLALGLLLIVAALGGLGAMVLRVMRRGNG
ncbi:MAG: peptidase MA family metallohydrolase, partial [Chloroflexi bacterium]|nr:peptidase MA family metallohydrolase [Chloroflexota bacterium]